LKCKIIINNNRSSDTLSQVNIGIQRKKKLLLKLIIIENIKFKIIIIKKRERERVSERVAFFDELVFFLYNLFLCM